MSDKRGSIDRPFVRGLSSIAAQVRAATGLRKSSGISDDAVMVASQILIKGSSLDGRDELTGPAEGVAAATFLCFVCLFITIFMEREGEKLDLHEYILESGVAAFCVRTYAHGEASTREALRGGAAQFKATLKKMDHSKKWLGFHDALSELVYEYVVDGKNSEQLPFFKNLYCILEKYLKDPEMKH